MPGPYLIMGWQRLRPLDYADLAVGLEGERGGVEADELASPPVASVVFFFHGREPVLPEHGADVPGGDAENGLPANR